MKWTNDRAMVFLIAILVIVLLLAVLFVARSAWAASMPFGEFADSRHGEVMDPNAPNYVLWQAGCAGGEFRNHYYAGDWTIDVFCYNHDNGKILWTKYCPLPYRVQDNVRTDGKLWGRCFLP